MYRTGGEQHYPDLLRDRTDGEYTGKRGDIGMIINLFPSSGFDPLSYYDSTLANNTPEQIQSAVRNGVADKLWAVGDVTDYIPTSAFANRSATSYMRAMILGFDHNEGIEGKGITFLFPAYSNGYFNYPMTLQDSGYATYKTSGTWFNMNNENSNAGGWASSNMRNTICPALFNAMPLEWQNVISDTVKYTDNVGNGTSSASNVTQTTDKIFLLSEYEVFGTISGANSAEQNYQSRYQYFTNRNSAKMYQYGSTSDYAAYWLRSPSISSNTSFRQATQSGGVQSNVATSDLDVPFVFRIG